MRNTGTRTRFTVTTGAFPAAAIHHEAFSPHTISATAAAGTRFASHLLGLRHHRSSLIGLC